MIPKIIHYCWFGKRPLPELVQKCIASWRHFCPDWEIKKWDEKNSPADVPYLRQALRHRRFINCANMVRFYAMYREGGVYCDTDVEFVKPFDRFLNEKYFLGFQPEREGEIFANVAVFGAERRHPFNKELLDELLRRFDGTESPLMPVPLSTELLIKKGLCCDKQAANCAVQIEGISVFPAHYFYPYGWWESFDAGCVREDTYAVHHWAKSWWRKSTWFQRLKKRFGIRPA